jgi:membrane protease subunit (stomatin/prohibitin family)
MEFKGKGVDIKTGRSLKFKTEHYGLSGCGLWLTFMNHDGTKFNSEAKLIGIMTEFRRGKYDCLIGNKIEVILIALQEFEGLKFKGKVAGT